MEAGREGRTQGRRRRGSRSKGKEEGGETLKGK